MTNTGTRAVLDKYIKKFESAEKTKSNEVRLKLSEIQELHIALSTLLLDHIETKHENSSLRQQVNNYKKSATPEIGTFDGGSFIDSETISRNVDGGSFK